MNTKYNEVSGVPEAQLIIDLTQTDLPLNTPVYAYIIGMIKLKHPKYYYVDKDGTPQLMKTGDNTIAAKTFPGMEGLTPEAQSTIAENYPSKWADYSIPVQVGSNLILNLGNISTDTIPGLGTGTLAFSGRIYFSVGVPKLPFAVASNGYTAPVFGNGSGVPGSLTIYDWIEFSYDSEGNFNGNTTQVNQFGFPLILTGTPVGKEPYAPQGTLNTSRETILSKIESNNEPFGGDGILLPISTEAAAAYPDNIKYYRAISPVTSSGAPANSYYNLINKYFDADIKKAYTAWQSIPLVTFDPSTEYYTGVVFPVSGASITHPSGYPEGSLAFYKGSYSTMADLAEAVKSSSLQPEFFLTGSSANTITSEDIWQCNNSLASGSAAQKNVGKMIGAAFNRGVAVSANGSVLYNLDDNTCANQKESFYPEGTNYNKWAKWFHGYNSNGLAYGFPYDDVCDQNPSIPPQNKTLKASFIRITLGKFFN